MKTEKIRVGVIGASGGSWAVRSHLPALKKLDDLFTVVAVSTRNIDSARETARTFDIENAFDNADDLINLPAVELVVVAVKVPEHNKLVSAALKAGKMVYCEWPLGNGLEEAKKLRDIAKENHIRTFCGLQSGSLPELKFLKAFLAEGKIGKIQATTVSGGGNNWGVTLPDESLAYLVDPKNGATMLHIPFAHLLDGLQFCMGEVRSFTALLTRANSEVTITSTNKKIPQLTYDQDVLNALLADEIVAVIHFHGGEFSGENLRWEIFGRSGRVTITSPTGHLQFGKLRIEAAYSDESSELLEIPDSFHPAEGGDPGYNADTSRSLYYAYQQVAADIQTGSEIFPSFEYALRHHELISSIEQQGITKPNAESSSFNVLK